MKILLVSLHFVEYAVELARALSSENTVHLILSKPKVSSTVKQSLDNLLGGKVSYTLLERYSGKNPLIIKNFIAIIKVLFDFRPDVVHYQESRDFSPLVLIPFSIFIPVVATIHDVEPHPGTERNNYLIAFGDFIRKRFYEKIIVHGHTLKNALVTNTKRNPDDIFVIPHGCLFSFKNAGSSKVDMEGERAILFFGRMEKYKGLRYLIEAERIIRRKVRDFKIIVAGRGQDLTLNKKFIDNNPHFEIHDRYIPNEEIAVLFERSSVVVLPYIEGSQSGVVAMAFAFAKPVIVTDVGSLAEVVEDGKTGIIISPGDQEGLAEAIISILENTEKSISMGKAAYEVANTALSWRRIAGLTNGVYQNALNAYLKQ